DGTFGLPRTFQAGPGPHGIAVGDFNRDGIPDLAVADLGPYPNRATTVAVLIGAGDGTFGAPRFFDAGHRLTGVAVGDFNRDGDGVQDLAIANWFATTVSVLLGNGDGTFRYGVQFGAGAAPEKVVVADFNEDGQPDLAVANYFGRSVSVLIDTTYTARVATPS